VSFKPGCGFRLVGHVVRRWINPARSFATLVLAVPGEKGERKHDLRAFGEMVDLVEPLGVGMTVEALGTIDVEALKNRAREDVKVDGYAVWVEKLTIRTLNVEGSSVAAPAKHTTAAAPVPGGRLPGDNVDW
jgi:hypothetical protein